MVIFIISCLAVTSQADSSKKITKTKIIKYIPKIPSEKSIQKIIKDIPKSINKISPENMEILKGMFNKQGGQ